MTPLEIVLITLIIMLSLVHFIYQWATNVYIHTLKEQIVEERRMGEEMVQLWRKVADAALKQAEK